MEAEGFVLCCGHQANFLWWLDALKAACRMHTQSCKLLLLLLLLLLSKAFRTAFTPNAVQDLSSVPTLLCLLTLYTIT
jgi:hypothetical protein